MDKLDEAFSGTHPLTFLDIPQVPWNSSWGPLHTIAHEGCVFVSLFCNPTQSLPPLSEYMHEYKGSLIFFAVWFTLKTPTWSLASLSRILDHPFFSTLEHSWYFSIAVIKCQGQTAYLRKCLFGVSNPLEPTMVRAAGSSWELKSQTTDRKPREEVLTLRDVPPPARQHLLISPASRHWGPSIQILETCGRHSNYHIEVPVSFNADSSQVTSLLFVLGSGGVLLGI